MKLIVIDRKFLGTGKSVSIQDVQQTNNSIVRIMLLKN